MAATTQINVLMDGAQAQAEARKTDASLDNIGKAATSGANQAKAALTQLESAVKSNRATIAAYDREILAARSDLAQLSNRLVETSQTYGKNSQQAQDLRTKIQSLSAATRGLVAEKALLANENGTLLNTLRTTEGAAEGARTGFNRLTTQIRTNGTIFQGFDGILQAVAGSVGGVTIVTGILISLVGALIPKIFELLSAKRDLNAATIEEIAVNFQSAQSYDALSNKASIAAQGFQSFEQNARAIADANIATTLFAIAGAQTEIEKQGKLVAAAFQSIKVNAAGASVDLAKMGVAEDFVAKNTGTMTAAITSGSEKIVEQQKILGENIATMRILRDVYGFTNERLIELAKRAGAIPTEIDAISRALNSDIDSMRAFADEISKTTNRMINMSLEAERLRLKLLEIKLPDFNISGTQRAVDQARGALAANLQTSGGDFTIAKDDIKRLNDELRAYAVEHAPNAKAAAAQYRLSLSQLSETERQAIGHLNQVEKNQEAFNKSHRSGASAAKAYANELSNLEQKAKDAEAALSGGSFAAREAKIKNEAQKMREQLAINKRDSVAAIDFVNRYEAAELKKLSSDKINAEFDFQDKITQLRIANITDERQRKLAEIDFQVRKERDRLQAQFGEEVAFGDALTQYRSELVVGFNNWDNEQHRKKLLEQGRATRAALQAELLAKTRAETEDAKARFDRSDRPGREDAQKAAQIERVARAFGFASRNAQTFALQLRALDKFNKGDFFGGLRLSIRAIADEMRNSQTAGERWASFLNNAVNQLSSNIVSGFEGIVNGTQTFGQLMKKLMFDLIASIAEQWGAYYLAIGIADLFWNPAQGAAEIAAGTALLALAGVLRGLSGAASKNAATGASSGGTSASASSPATSRPAPETRRLPVTSGSSQGAQPQILFDASNTDKLLMELLTKKGVLTVENINRKNREVFKSAVKTIVRVPA